jgi:hypothetical protein
MGSQAALIFVKMWPIPDSDCLFSETQGYDHVQAYLGICQKKLYVKKIYVKKIYVKKSRAQFLNFVWFSHVTSILGFTKLF